MASLVDSVRAMLRRYRMIMPGAPVVVAVSGGPDSLCLLDALVHLRDDLACDLHVVHLDHRLRGAEAAAEAAFVAETAACLNLPCTVEAVDVRALALERNLNLHAAGRLARYRLLARVALTIGAQAVATAHHADDQAETVLLHLVRGAGVAGLRGMRPVVAWEEWRTFAGDPSLQADHLRPRLIRPLLDVPRARIEAYCTERGLTPRRDPSNADRRYLRTRIRQDVLPVLTALNPQIATALGRTAADCAEVADFLEQELDRAWLTLVVARANRIVFDGRRWRDLPPALQHAALRRAYALLGGSDTLGRDDVVRACDAVGRGVGKRIELPGGVALVTDYDGGFALMRGDAPPGDGVRLPVAEMTLTVPGCVELSDGRALCADYCPAAMPTSRWDVFLNATVCPSPLTVRWRRPGDRMRLEGGRGSRRLQDIMVDARVPRLWRSTWPIVVSGEQIVWVPGVGVAEGMHAMIGQPALHLWIEGMTGVDVAMGIEREHSMHDDMAKILITAGQIQERVRALGAQITADYRPLGDLLLVGVLKGCAMFMVDLARAIDMPLAMDFIATSSYGKTTESSGVVRMLKDLDTDIAGRHVVIVEDIIDSGLTLAYLRGHLLRRNPASLRICALLNKPSRRRADIPIDYLGFDIPNEFVVGYGLDFDEKYRNLPYIGVLHERIYHSTA
ncbi:hypoxanthine phosphoribosyltransferase [Roseiflexus castenholzii]|uniref:tRNA(Ile)-lysidine synthase n=2 Tax=Chloroflexota TaxID=200795 RepID=A7NHN4_ROSCS|nr:hypoxanthine phosphoribosyltransferase [Roseiflexus castenholzii DSM 13941]